MKNLHCKYFLFMFELIDGIIPSSDLKFFQIPLVFYSRIVFDLLLA